MSNKTPIKKVVVGNENEDTSNNSLFATPTSRIRMPSNEDSNYVRTPKNTPVKIMITKGGVGETTYISGPPEQGGEGTVL